MRISLTALFCILLFAAPAWAQSDEELITAAAMDYIEGWYTGDAARMERALHPDLVKRYLQKQADGSFAISDMTAAQLVEGTKRGGGTHTPDEQKKMEVQVLDVFQRAACARIDAGTWIDYLQLSKIDGQWKIVNVLWEIREE